MHLMGSLNYAKAQINGFRYFFAMDLQSIDRTSDKKLIKKQAPNHFQRCIKLLNVLCLDVETDPGKPKQTWEGNRTKLFMENFEMLTSCNFVAI